MRTNGEHRITYPNGNGHHVKSPAEIEREIDATRMRMEQTIQAIKNDLTPGQLVDHAFHYFKDGKVGEVAGNVASSVGRSASNAASSIGRTAKSYPLQTGLVGAGLIWLAASTYKSKHQQSVGGVTAIEPPMEAGIYGPGTYGSVDEGGRLQGAKSRIKGAASSVKGRTSAAKARASNATHGAAERARHMSHGAAERARIARERSVAGARRAKDGAQRTFDERPLVVGLAAIGVGALLGALVPLSSRENQVLGRRRDDLMKKADELGAKTLDKAKSVVDQGVSKVKSSMESSAGIVDGGSLQAEQSQTTGEMMGSTAYGTSSTNPIIGGATSEPREREVGGVGGIVPSDLPDKDRGPGF